MMVLFCSCNYLKFNTLEHHFLIRALEFFGFGSNFCNIIRMFYNYINIYKYL